MHWLINRLQDNSSKIAIADREIEYSYETLKDKIEEYYVRFQKEITPGECVTILSDYSFYSIAAFIALLINKNIIVPITTKVTEEIEDRISTSGAEKNIVIKSENLSIESVGNSSERHQYYKDLINLNHSGLVLFSSGSTGKPKAMVHDLDVLVETYINKKQRGLNFLVFLMFDHIGGLNTLLNCLSMGATITIPEYREPEHICKLIEKYNVNVLPSSPTFLNLLILSESHRKYDLSSLIMITYGTEPMPEELLRRIKEAFPKTKLLQTFGTSETGITTTASKSSSSTFIKIDDPNTDYKIVEGELWIKSKTQILGYLNASMDRFTEDGWFKTGDLTEATEDGFIKIIGRNSDIINVGGEKVLPAEVESVLLQMPEIADCMVYGENNPLTGQIVVADVVLKNESVKNDIKKLIQRYCGDKISRYKIPVKIKVKDRTSFSDRFKKIRR